MRKKLLSTVFLCCLCFVLPVQAQTQESNITEMTPDDYAHLELPPLEVLFENAKNNPVMQIQDIKQKEEISLLKKEKRNWLNYFSVNAGYSYGILGNTSGFSDSATPLYYQFNENTQHSYHIGGSILIPIESLFDLKPKVNRQRLRIKEIDIQKEQIIDELKQQIIELYTSILSSISVLKLKAEALAFANAQYKIGEQDFLNGKGGTDALGAQKQMQIKAVIDYESTRVILNSALLKLEIISRTPLLKKDKTK